MNDISQYLLNMDIERGIHLFLFLLLLIGTLKLLISIHKKTKTKFLKIGCNGLIISIVIFLFVELFVRVVYFVGYKETGFLIYPFRAYTRDYLNLSWTPPYYLKDGEPLTCGINEGIPTVLREYEGMNYLKAVQNYNGFRFNPLYYPKNRVNIICLGGSSTWGHNSDGLTYPDFLENILDKNKVKVYNLGKRGHMVNHFIDNIKKSGLTNRITVDIAI